MTTIGLALLIGAVLPTAGERPLPENTPEPASSQDHIGCGYNSLFLVCRLKRIAVDPEGLRSALGPPDDGGLHSFSSLEAAAEKLGLHAVGVKADRAALIQLPTPAIVQLNRAHGAVLPHFVALVACAPDGVYLLDAPHPVRLVPWGPFERAWTGNTLLFGDTSEEAMRIRRLCEGAVWSARLPWALGLIDLAVVSLSLVALGWHRYRRRLDALESPQDVGSPRFPVLSPLIRWRPQGVRTRLAVAATFVLFGVALASWAGYHFFSRHATLALARDVIDLGEMSPGRNVSAIPVRNSGNSSLIIRNVRSSCACTVVEYPKRIEASETATLKLSLNVTEGPREAQLEIDSNDPAGTRMVYLRWLGSARPCLVPRRLVGQDVPMGSVYQRVVRLVYPGGRSATSPHVEEIKSNTSSVHITVDARGPQPFEQARPPVSELELHVDIESPSTPRAVEAQATLVVKYGERKYELLLPIHVDFAASVTPSPNRIVFAARKITELRGQRRLVTLSAADPHKVSVIQCPSWLKCTLLERTPTTANLEIKVAEIPSASAGGEAILLTTSPSGRSAVTIPVVSFVETKD